MLKPEALDLTAHFSRFRAAAPGRINLAAHSHHDWPDATWDAQMQCWQDAARFAGDKWEVVLGEVARDVAQGITSRLNLRDPATIAFAPNTHELLQRIISGFEARARLSVLTSDAEFHTFRRQMARLIEDDLVALEVIPAEPFASFPERFVAAARGGRHDLVFVSQVFFTSGATCGDLGSLAAALPDVTPLVIDGYHGWMAVPTDLSALASRLFYLSGGYKYAMAGEGVCFLHAPDGFVPRPRDTGWFAEFAALAAPPGLRVGYPEKGARFAGATFDPSGLYRQRAVFGWLDALDVSVAAIHRHARVLMQRFLAAIPAHIAGEWETLTPLDLAHGNFVTFRTEQAGLIARKAAELRIASDHRGDRLRFGFGLCTSVEDVETAAARLWGGAS
jgi:selenocysteine lyase/cysteine desulfurase